jgi:hypothetical protein
VIKTTNIYDEKYGKITKQEFQQMFNNFDVNLNVSESQTMEHQGMNMSQNLLNSSANNIGGFVPQSLDPRTKNGLSDSQQENLEKQISAFKKG